jgi:hypothetical protein
MSDEKKNGTGTPTKDVTFQRGEADGRRGHPPAEVSVIYLRGYAEGLQQKK